MKNIKIEDKEHEKLVKAAASKGMKVTSLATQLISEGLKVPTPAKKK